MLIKGAIRKGTAAHKYIQDLLDEHNQRGTREIIRKNEGNISFHCLSAIHNDKTKECYGCKNEFYPSNKTQSTCTMKCRDMVRRYTKRGLPMPRYKLDDPKPRMRVEDMPGYDDL